MSRGTKDLLSNVQTQRVQRVSAGDPRRPSLLSSDMYEPCPPPTTTGGSSSKLLGKQRLSESDEEEAALMSSLAARGPISVGGGGNSGVAVDALVQELRQKVDRQKMELDSRMDNVNAIQRNFQRLSEMYSTDREKLVAAEQEAALLREELAALRAEKKFASAVRAEFTALKAEHEALKASSERSAEEGRQLAAANKNRITQLEKEDGHLRKAVEETTASLLALRENEQRIVHVVADLETRANAVLLSVLEAQKVVSQADASLTASVGSGVGFVAPPAAAASSANHKSGSTYPLRVEAVAHALQVCGDKAIPVLLQAHQLLLQVLSSKASAAKLQEEQCIEANRELSAARESNAKLQRELLSLAQRFDSERTTLIGEVAKLTSQLASGKQGESEQLAKTTAELMETRALVEKLEQKVSEVQAACNAAQATLESVNESSKGKLQALTLECQQLREHRDRLSSDVEHRQMQLNEMEQRMLGATTRMNQLQEEVNKARDALKAVQSASSSQVSQVHADLASARRTISEMQQAMSKLEMQAAELRQLRADHEVLLKSAAQANASSTSLSLQVRTLENQIATLRQALESATSSADQALQTVREKLASQEVENRMLQASFDSLQRDRQDSDKKLDSLRKQLDSAAAERDQLSKLLKESESAGSEKQELLSRLQRSQSDAKQLEIKVASLLDELRGAGAAARDLSDARLRIKDLENELESANEATGNAKALQQLTLAQLDSAERERKNTEAKMIELKATTDVILATQAAFEKTRKELEDHAGRAAARARHLRTLQEETCKTVKKLLTAEKSCESGYSCQQCLQLLKDPIVCGPCGHVYCRKCFEDSNKSSGRSIATAGAGGGGKPLRCTECDMNSVTMVVPAHSLDLLSGKFQYRCQVLSDLSSLLDKELLSAPL